MVQAKNKGTCRFESCLRNQSDAEWRKGRRSLIKRVVPTLAADCSSETQHGPCSPDRTLPGGNRPRDIGSSPVPAATGGVVLMALRLALKLPGGLNAIGDTIHGRVACGLYFGYGFRTNLPGGRRLSPSRLQKRRKKENSLFGVIGSQEAK